jgi:hypothetical protein
VCGPSSHPRSDGKSSSLAELMLNNLSLGRGNNRVGACARAGELAEVAGAGKNVFASVILDNMDPSIGGVPHPAPLDAPLRPLNSNLIFKLDVKQV